MAVKTQEWPLESCLRFLVKLLQDKREARKLGMWFMPGIPAFRRLKQDSHCQAPSQKTDSKAAATCCVWSCNHNHLGVKGRRVSSSRSSSATCEVQRERGGKGIRGRERLCLKSNKQTTTTNSFHVTVRHKHTDNMVLFPAPLAAQYETLRNKRAHILGRCVLPEASI